MSNPNFPTQAQNDAKYATQSGMIAAIAAQATTDAGQYASLTTIPVGSRANGETDDTAAINRAVTTAAALSGARVLFDSRKTYIVTPSNSSFGFTGPSGTATTIQVCVPIPSNVLIDLNGSTVQLGGTTPATIFTNAHPTNPGTRDSKLGLVNGVIDGGGLSLSAAGLVTFAYADYLTLGEITIQNGVYQGLFGFNLTHVYGKGEIRAKNFQGQPISLGSPVNVSNGTPNLIYDSHFDAFIAENITALNGGSQPGNSVAIAPNRVTIGRIEARTCDAGIKLYGPGSDLEVDTTFSKDTGFVSGNSGLKFQGDTGNGWYPTRFHVKQATSINSGGTGLYMDYCIDCSVDNYVGLTNNLLGTGPDVWIGGTRDSILAIRSIAAGADAVQVRSYATDWYLGRIHARNPGQVVASTSGLGLSVNGGNGSVGDLTVLDDQVTTLSSGLSTSAAITSLAVISASPALASGATIVVTSGANTQTFTLSAATAAGATSLPISSSTPTYAFPAGSTVSTPTMIHGLGVNNASSILQMARYSVNGARSGAISLASGSVVRNTVGQAGPPVLGSITLPAAASLVAGQAIRQQLRTGLYYSAFPTSSYTTANTLPNGSLRLAQFAVPRTMSLASISASPSVAGDAGTTFRMGVYNDDGTGYPGSLVMDFGTIAADSTGTKEITVNPTNFPSNTSVTSSGLSLIGGDYWLGGVVQGPTVTLSSALSTSGAVTTLSVSAIPNALASGATAVIASGTYGQTFTLTASASAGATSLTVTSVTPNYAYPAGSTVGVLSTIPTMYVISGLIGSMPLGSTLPAGNAGTMAAVQTSVPAALPTTFTTSTAFSGVMARIFVKAGA